MPSSSRPFTRGVTVVEVAIAAGIGGLLIAALFLITARSFDSAREQFQQTLTNEDARIQLERITDTLRNASANGSIWLIEAEDYSISFYVNIDADADIEAVQYVLDGEELWRNEIDSEGTTTNVVARTVQNMAEELPMFTYYNHNLEIIPASEATSDTVKRIGINLLIDADPNNPPGAAAIATQVTVRGVLVSGEAAAALLPQEFNYPVNPLSDGSVEISTLDPETLEATESEIIDIRKTNDGRLATFTDHYYVHINYQEDTVGDDAPGWYAWIGPIFLKQAGTQTYSIVDKVPLNDVCQGISLQEMLADEDACGSRTVGWSNLLKTYKPIITHGFGGGGNEFYIRDFSFTYEAP